MNLSTEDLPEASVTTVRILAGIYRSTFVDAMRERFQSMLAGAYAVYVTALGEGFDPALRAHLTDILQDIIARTAELTNAFEEELMCCFRTAIELSERSDPGARPEGEAERPQPQDFSGRFAADPSVHEFIAKTIRSIETRHGSIILAVTRTYVRLAGQSDENFRPPWSPAGLFSAFAAVLGRIGVPIHEKVQLALYKMFAQEVLRHLGDACLGFRDALPTDLADLDVPRREDKALFESGALVSKAATARYDSAEPAYPKLVRADSDDRRSMDGDSTNTGSASAYSEGAPKSLKLFQVLLLLLLGGGVIGGGWWIGRNVAKYRTGTLFVDARIREAVGPVGEPPPGKPSSEPAMPEPLAKPQLSDQPVPVSPSAGTAAAPPSAAGEAPPVEGLDLQQKREVLRNVKLKNFSWRRAPGKDEMLFDLQIANTGDASVGGIEVVCSQYSSGLDFLEAAKTVLAEPIEPGQTKAFSGIRIGFSSKQTERVNCVIADASVL